MKRSEVNVRVIQRIEKLVGVALVYIGPRAYVEINIYPDDGPGMTTAFITSEICSYDEAGEKGCTLVPEKQVQEIADFVMKKTLQFVGEEG